MSRQYAHVEEEEGVDEQGGAPPQPAAQPPAQPTAQPTAPLHADQPYVGAAGGGSVGVAAAWPQPLGVLQQQQQQQQLQQQQAAVAAMMGPPPQLEAFRHAGITFVADRRSAPHVKRLISVLVALLPAFFFLTMILPELMYSGEDRDSAFPGLTRSDMFSCAIYLTSVLLFLSCLKSAFSAVPNAQPLGMFCSCSWACVFCFLPGLALLSFDCEDYFRDESRIRDQMNPADEDGDGWSCRPDDSQEECSARMADDCTRFWWINFLTSFVITLAWLFISVRSTMLYKSAPEFVHPFSTALGPPVAMVGGGVQPQPAVIEMATMVNSGTVAQGVPMGYATPAPAFNTQQQQLPIAMAAQPVQRDLLRHPMQPQMQQAQPQMQQAQPQMQQAQPQMQQAQPQMQQAQPQSQQLPQPQQQQPIAMATAI